MRSQRLTPFPFLALSALAGLTLSGCGGQEKFANSNTAVSNAASDDRSDKDLAVAQNGAVVEPVSLPGKYGGKMVDATPGDPKTFNLWVAGDATSSDAAGRLYSSLMERNSYTLQWESALAELPQVSADGLTWTFALKPGLKWSDGAPITADDVIFTLNVIYDLKVQTNFRESMMLDAPDGKGGFKRVPLKYRKIDAQTVEFKFPVKYAPAREILAFAIAPKHKLEKFWKQGQPKTTGINPAWGVDVDVKELVSSGPWIITDYKPSQRIVYGRNPNYWKKSKTGQQLPYLDQYVNLIVPDFNTTTLKFLAGDTDVLSVKQDDYKTVKAKEKSGNFLVRNLGPTFSTAYLGFNMNMRSKPAKDNPELFKLFNDTRFRQAVSHAVDREKLVRNVYAGLARPGYGAESPANKAFYAEDLPKTPFDLDKSKSLLAEIGLKDSNGDQILELPNGKPVTFNIITNVENKLRVGIATIVSADLRKIGIDAKFTPLAFNSVISKLDNKPEKGKPYPPFDWQAVILGWTAGIEPNGGKNIWTSAGNFHQWDPYQEKPHRPWEAKIDDLFRRGAQEMDETKRKVIYDEFQKIVSEQQPFIYTVVPDSIYALKDKYQNIKPCPVGNVTWNIEEIFESSATRDKP